MKGFCIDCNKKLINALYSGDHAKQMLKFWHTMDLRDMPIRKLEKGRRWKIPVRVLGDEQ